MKRAALEDPEARQLFDRLRVMMHFGGRALLFETPAMHPGADLDVDVTYRLRQGPDQPLVKEELELIMRLSDAVADRLPSDITLAEKRVLAAELVSQDPELAALAARLEELSESHSGAVLGGLAQLAKEDEEDEEADSEEPR